MEKRLTLLEHIEELRLRIIKSLVLVFIASCLAYCFIDPILYSLIKPVGEVIFLSPQEAFTSKLSLSFWIGLFASLPFILYQIWAFAREGLKSSEQKYVLIFAPASLVFFLAGAAFGYFIIVPIGVKFLLAFGNEILRPMISIGQYISFVGVFTFSFGLVFELPLMLVFLTKIGVVTPRLLSIRRRYAIVGIFIAAAILTPPDVVSQLLLAGPLVALYEMGIIFSRLAYRGDGA